MRIIDADALDIMEYREEFPNGAEDIAWNAAVRMINDYIQRVPTLDYKDLVPQGEWIETTYKSFIPTEQPENGFVVTHSHVGYRCSRCGRVEEKKEPFCHCGVRMKGGRSDG